MFNSPMLTKEEKKEKTVTLKSGAVFFVDGLPKHRKQNIYGKNYHDYELCKNKTLIYNHAKMREDIDIIPQMRSFFEGLDQPTENTVQRAMIWTFDEDYAIKSGGESKSDRFFSSSLCFWTSDPKTYEDKKEVLIKKYSMDFNDVLITLEELEELYSLCMTEKEKKDNLIDGEKSLVAEGSRYFLKKVKPKAKSLFSSKESLVNLIVKCLNKGYSKSRMLTYADTVITKYEQQKGNTFLQTDSRTPEQIQVENIKDCEIRINTFVEFKNLLQDINE